jgi:hypothetical protein
VCDLCAFFPSSRSPATTDHFHNPRFHAYRPYASQSASTDIREPWEIVVMGTIFAL